MKHLITITEETFGRPTPKENIDYIKRKAARAVLMGRKGQVYLLNVTSQGYHKLPGGGINDDEDIKQALKREILEEVGCEAEIGQEIGEVLEYRATEEEQLEQYSYSYIARQSGELSEQSLEQDEIDVGHDLVTATNIDEAISILESDKPRNKEGKYIQLRDLTILKEAKRLMAAS